MAIRVLAPDVIAVLEGPSSAARMNLFQKTFLNDEFDVISNDESGDQLVSNNDYSGGGGVFAFGLRRQSADPFGW